MATTNNPQLSLVIPVFNEGPSLAAFHQDLTRCLDEQVKLTYEIIYCNDGSTDDTVEIISKLHQAHSNVRMISFSRNFGKEIATTAGIHQAKGQAVLVLDGDGQHPIDRIPDFVAAWQAGSKVVVGVCVDNQHTSWFRRSSSKLFYRLANRFTGARLVPGATDFCLIDADVQAQFKTMTEHARITRGLIDWLGYDRTYIKFEASPRLSGSATYSHRQLFRLAVDSVVSLSVSPLYAAIYVGVVIIPISLLLGCFLVLNEVLSDPWNLHITGSAYVVTLLLFLVGIVLISQGIIGLYVSHIHAETQNRPLFVIDDAKSVGLPSKSRS